MRLRIALIAAVASITLGLVAVPAATAANGTPHKPKNNPAPLYTVRGINGASTNGKQFKNGSYGIQRFIVGTLNGKRGVYAVGVLRGRFQNRNITLYNVKMPAGLTGATAGTAQAAAVCPVLHLVLGPINLNLLGLQVTLAGGNVPPGTPGTQPITLNLTAISGPGNLLGNLLCGLSNALNGPGTGGGTLLGQLSGQLQQLNTTLNSILVMLGGL
jgi:hypothetical protein